MGLGVWGAQDVNEPGYRIDLDVLLVILSNVVLVKFHRIDF